MAERDGGEREREREWKPFQDVCDLRKSNPTVLKPPRGAKVTTVLDGKK